MRIILILGIIAYIKSYISSYYKSCKKNAPKGSFSSLGSDECRKYNPSNGYCCVLSYYVKNYDNTKYNECIGITKDGYKNIYDLEVDIEEDKNLDSVSIQCTSKILNLFYISLLLLNILLI